LPWFLSGVVANYRLGDAYGFGGAVFTLERMGQHCLQAVAGDVADIR
jgi:hypothetical protein